MVGGGGSSAPEQPPGNASAGVPVQTSVLGIPVQLTFGCTRIAGNLIELYGYEYYYTPGQSAPSGGKGFGGGGGGGGSNSSSQGGHYNYFSTMVFGLCEGPIVGVRTMWINDTPKGCDWTIFPGTYPQPFVWHTEAYAGLGYCAFNRYGLGDTANLPNFGWEVVTQYNSTSFAYPTMSPADGFGTVVTYLTVHPEANLSAAYNALHTAGQVNVVVLPQVDMDPSLIVVSLLTDPYSGASFPAANIGGVILNTEVRTIPGSGPYTIAPNKAALWAWQVNVLDLTSGLLLAQVSGTPATGQYAIDPTTHLYTFNAAQTGHSVSLRYVTRTGFADFQNYTMAQGLWMSPTYDTQNAANSMIGDICDACHSTPVWTSGLLNIVPRGTVNISANGFNYIAPSTPLFALNDDDFVDVNAQGGGPTGAVNGAGQDDPVILTRTRPADQVNDIKLEYLNRANYYVAAIAEAKDQANIDTFGLRAPQSITMHHFCDVNAANVSVQLMIQDQSVRNTYSFTVDQRYCGLDPMDIVAITDLNNTGVVGQWVQLTEITENSDGTLSMIANEYPAGTGAAAVYNFEPNVGYQPSYNLPSGSVNPPMVFAAPPQLAKNQALELWLAISGQNTLNWGGCDVHVSTDGTTYKLLGRQTGATRMGVTTTDLPVGLDPDLINSVSINLSESAGYMISGTVADADKNNTVCLIRGVNGDEFISYQQASLIAANKYTLGAYLRRGQFQTNSVDHPIGSDFVRVDELLFRIPYQPTDIGTTLHLKFASFNPFGGGEEELASVAAYTITVPQPPLPPDVTGFTAAQFGTAVSFKWNALEYPLVALAGYYLGYAPQGSTDWSMFTMLTVAQGGDGTEMTNADVPPGNWTFGIRGVNIANQPGTTNGMSQHMATADLVVVNNTSVVDNTEQAPDWGGHTAGFTADGFGALIPNGTFPVEHYVQLAPPAAPGLSSVVSGLALTFTAFVKITYVTATGETIGSVEASQAITSGHAVQVASPPAYGNATGYNVYVGTSSGAESQQNGTPIAIGTPWTQSLAVFAGAGLPGFNTTGCEPFTKFVPDPTERAYYITPTVDAGLDLQSRIFLQSIEKLGPLQGGTPGTGFSYAIDTWLSAGFDTDVFTPWTIGSLNLRYCRSMLFYQPVTPDQVEYVTEFLPFINQVSSVVASSSVTIAPGGTTVLFTKTYATLPFVVATPVAATALSATVSAITTSQCVVHVWNSAGVDVGGVVNMLVTGE